MMHDMNSFTRWRVCVIKDRGDRALEVRLYMRRVTAESYRTYLLVAENDVGSTRHRVTLARGT